MKISKNSSLTFEKTHTLKTQLEKKFETIFGKLGWVDSPFIPWKLTNVAQKFKIENTVKPFWFYAIFKGSIHFSSKETPPGNGVS